MQEYRVGIIGGTGANTRVIDGPLRQVETPYGTVNAVTGRINGRDVVYVRRHGPEHQPPHRINYRANVCALKQFGVEVVLATNSVGAIDHHHIGDFVVPVDFIDLTRNRDYTFYDEEAVHVDMTEPYCPCIRDALERATGAREAIYVCTEGPRFETPAEIRMMRQAGGTVVGMTGVPEVVLAREAGLCYASLALVTNKAAGIDGKLSAEEVLDILEERGDAMREAIEKAIGLLPEERWCDCVWALRRARVSKK